MSFKFVNVGLVFDVLKTTQLISQSCEGVIFEAAAAYFMLIAENMIEENILGNQIQL